MGQYLTSPFFVCFRALRNGFALSASCGFCFVFCCFNSFCYVYYDNHILVMCIVLYYDNHILFQMQTFIWLFWYIGFKHLADVGMQYALSWVRHKSVMSDM
jgi:hypothetical protein